MVALARLEAQVTVGGAPAGDQRVEVRSAVVGPLAGPGVLHDLDGLGLAPLHVEHAKPRVGALLVLLPEKDVGAHALLLATNGGAIALLVKVRLRGAGLLDGAAPVGLRHLPEARRPPLGKDIGLVPTVLGEPRLDVPDVAVGVDADEVERRRAPLKAAQLRGQTRAQRRQHRVIRIFFVDGLRQLVDRVVDLPVDRRLALDVRVAAVGQVVKFVSQLPEEHGRVVFVRAHHRHDRFELLLHGLGGAVVHAAALRGDRQVKLHGEAPLMCAVEHLGVAGTDGIAAVPGEPFEVRSGAFGPLHVTRLAAAHDLKPAAALLHDFNRHRRRLVGAGRFGGGVLGSGRFASRRRQQEQRQNKRQEGNGTSCLHRADAWTGNDRRRELSSLRRSGGEKNRAPLSEPPRFCTGHPVTAPPHVTALPHERRNARRDTTPGTARGVRHRRSPARAAARSAR